MAVSSKDSSFFAALASSLATSVPWRGVPIDDVLDAAAAAWSGQRIAEGTARCLPDSPESVQGRVVAIWY